MESKVQSWQLVEHFFDASVSPERVDELIAAWDAQMERAGLNQPRLAEFAGPAFAHQIGEVLQILEQLRRPSCVRPTISCRRFWVPRWC